MKDRILVLLIFCLFGVLRVVSAKTRKKAIARVGDTFLYEEDIASLLKNTKSSSDSALFINNYVTNWAKKQLLLDKAKINLPEEQLIKFNRLVKDYKADLYTRAYLEPWWHKRKTLQFRPNP